MIYGYVVCKTETNDSERIIFGSQWSQIIEVVFFLVGGTNNEASISFPFVYKSSSVALGSRKIQASLVLVKLN